MAKYDQSDFRPPLPGGAVPPAGTGAAGSAPAQPHEMAGERVTITTVGGGAYTTDVDAADVLAPSQESLYRDPGRESISGVDGIGSTGAGKGRAEHVPHPNAGS